MPRLLLLFVAFFCPLLVFSQSWKLKQYYPVAALENTKSRIGPEALRSAFAPDSVLSVYRPENDPSVEEILRQPDVFTPNPDFLDLRRGDIIWVKLECINTESTNARYLI